MKKQIIILVAVIVLVVLLDVFFLVYKKQNSPEEVGDKNQISNRYSCYKDMGIYTNPDNGIQFTSNEVYSFYVMGDKSLRGDMSITSMVFNNLEDLYNYQTYLKDYYHYAENDHSSFEIDESTFTLVYKHRGLYGSNVTKLDEYLDNLATRDYKCEEIEVEG